MLFDPFSAPHAASSFGSSRPAPLRFPNRPKNNPPEPQENDVEETASCGNVAFFPLMSSSPSADTIVAQATAHGAAAISVVRISGPLAPTLVRDIFGPRTSRPRCAQRGNYRNLEGILIDDVLYSWFPKPRSYTGDDVVEISCHGNPLIVQKILQDLLHRGCRLADPGEFTRVAFLNGQMDLSQAEAVIDVIRAQSDRALAAAHHQLQGALSTRVSRNVDLLLQVIAHLEAYIDFPEEDLPTEDETGPVRQIRDLVHDLQRLASTSRYGSLLREGVRTIILGAPNVGKSSLLNRLVGHERVIVSDEPGTTRDAVEERLAIGPYSIRIMDTAGIRASTDKLELLSIEKTLTQVEQADLFLLILDATLPHPVLPDALRARLNATNTLVVQNKVDLLPDASSHLPSWAGLPEVRVSALTGEGMEDLENRLRETIDAFNPLASEDFVAVSARHAEALHQAARALETALDQLARSEPAELVASHLREALHALGQITGQVDNEAMLDKLFSTFCIGK